MYQLQKNQAVSSIRPIIINIKDVNNLFNLYIPYIKQGGLFIPTSTTPQIQNVAPKTRVQILLTLMNSPTKRSITGSVIWIAQGTQTHTHFPGIGVQFDDNEQSRLLKDEIEKFLIAYNGKTTNNWTF